MISILFVDDEPNILSGLKRLTRSMRTEWTTYFAESGAEALEIIRNTEIDIVISDMKMPAMDGAELLRRIRESHPSVIRIILSGYAESEMVMKSVSQAHQYMTKPCDSELLTSTIKRAFALHDLMTNTEIQKRLAEMQFVPSIPTLYEKLIDELNADDPNMKMIGDIVEQDIGMTAKLLQIVNSAFFGLRRTISDPGSALKLLGLDTFGSLVFSLGVIQQLENGSSMGEMISTIWSRSLRVGNLAKKIAAKEDSSIQGSTYTAGLLHDIGTLVLAVNFPEEVDKINKLVGDGAEAEEAEVSVLGTSQAQVGAYLLSLWGLPRDIVEAVMYHRRPGDFDETRFSSAMAVHTARLLVDNHDPDEQRPAPVVDAEYLTAIGKSDRYPIWHRECVQIMEVTG